MSTSSVSTPNIYYNNNDLKLLNGTKMSDTITSTNSSEATATPKPSIKKPSSSPKKCCFHLNNLWSLWYGVIGTGLQAYTAIKSAKRLLGYSLLGWTDEAPIPYFELNCSLGLIGAAVLLLPVFLAAALFKIGNLANDGFKLGRQLSTCSREPPADVLTSHGSCRLFRHGGPTAPFVHFVVAFCLLLPKLLMEARLIQAGFLPQDWIWRTDLDFIGLHKDRMVILSFMTANSTSLAQVKRSAIALPLSSNALPLTTSSDVTNTVIKTLKHYIGHENHTVLETGQMGWGSSVSLEYMNLAIALIVYSVRYPALFWSTNKCLGIVFSFQLVINGLHTLLAYSGMSILYKVQIVGGWQTLPLLKLEPGALFTFNNLSSSPFLLNPQVTLALYMMSTLLILASSLVLYLYGHTRLNAFLSQEREKKVITLKEQSSSKWGYFTHCAALCVLISVGICNAPLLHDYTVLYKGSLDDTTLACIVGSLFYLFFWIVIWLFLTIKHTWIFKLRVTVGKATVRKARSLRLVTDINLMTSRGEDLSQQPLLIVGNGRTYNITETSPKKAIMSVIQKAAMSKKAASGFVASNQNGGGNDDEEQIYWLRPVLASAQSSPDEAKPLCWFKSKPKHKVTFNETTSTSVNRCKSDGVRGRRITMDEDDGDYATLRQLPLPPSMQQRPESRDDNVSEEGKPSSQTPRCLRRADSGMPHDELPTPRSGSVSTTASSSSPPEAPGNLSETSSGVHSNESEQRARRATSVVDLLVGRDGDDAPWKSASLQRNTPPPQSTVVIRRKVQRPAAAEVGPGGPALKDEPFGRATNMRMTSFMEKNDAASSATLPHFPTQPAQSVYAHCSTMPLPQHGAAAPAPQGLTAGSCIVYPRQHTTLPTHHNGVKLPQNASVVRFKCREGGGLRNGGMPEGIYSGVNKGELFHRYN